MIPHGVEVFVGLDPIDLVEPELMRRRILASKAERLDSGQLEMEFAAVLAELDRLNSAPQAAGDPVDPPARNTRGPRVAPIRVIWAAPRCGLSNRTLTSRSSWPRGRLRCSGLRRAARSPGVAVGQACSRHAVGRRGSGPGRGLYAGVARDH